MTQREYDLAIKRLVRLAPLLETSGLNEKQLYSYVESTVMVKAHAWCMDVKSERRKMAQLFLEVVSKI